MSGRHLGALVGLLVTLSACTVLHRWAYARRSTSAVASGRLDVDRLLSAIEYLESSHKNYPPYKDGKEWAWGLFGMHMDRWEEIGGKFSTWGHASPETQRRLMRAELARRRFTSLRDVARWQNGRGSAHIAYWKKLEREYGKH